MPGHLWCGQCDVSMDPPDMGQQGGALLATGSEARQQGSAGAIKQRRKQFAEGQQKLVGARHG